MSLLDTARKSLNKSLSSTNSIAGQSYALDSIASSLLYIAENLDTKPSVDTDQVELVVRRLLDETLVPNPKKGRGKK